MVALPGLARVSRSGCLRLEMRAVHSIRRHYRRAPRLEGSLRHRRINRSCLSFLRIFLSFALFSFFSFRFLRRSRQLLFFLYRGSLGSSEEREREKKDDKESAWHEENLRSHDVPGGEMPRSIDWLIDAECGRASNTANPAAYSAKKVARPLYFSLGLAILLTYLFSYLKTPHRSHATANTFFFISSERETSATRGRQYRTRIRRLVQPSMSLVFCVCPSRGNFPHA